MQHQQEENVNLSSLADAQRFLDQFDWHAAKLEAAQVHDDGLLQIDDDAPPSPGRVRAEVVRHWSDIMAQLPLEQQQDRLFQNTLTAALENVILSQVHDRVCQELHEKHKEEDGDIWSHCQYLTKINLPADKLGIPEGYALSFPAAVVELAALDIQRCPLDKLRCLRSTLDYIEAEIKRSIADTHNISEDAEIPPITSGDMVSLLAAVLIQAKPLHLATNLNYIESYQQTLSPCDPLCTSLETFRQALSLVLNTSVEEEEEIKPVRLGRGMSKEIELEELAQLACYMGKAHQGNSDENQSVTPLDCQLHQLAGRIEKAMDNDDSQSQMEALLNNFEVDYENNFM